MLLLIWNTILIFPIANVLVFLYHLLGGSLGLAIIALTVVIKIVTLPLSLPSLKAAKKQRDLAPKLAEIKARFKDDKKAQMAAQAKFLKENGLNPGAGCLLQILTIVILIALYNVLSVMLGLNQGVKLNDILYEGLKFSGNAVLNFNFLYLNLGKPDPYLVLPILAAVFQFLLSKMMLPTVSKEEKLARKTPGKSDDFMYNMQEQSLYLMPVMTILIGWKLASGLVLYWLLSSFLQLLQQLLMDGHIARWSKHVVKYVK